MKRFFPALVALGALAAAAPAAAQTYRLVSTDGTVHFTNTPTDPRYRREGLVKGSAARWVAAPVVVDVSPYTLEIRQAADRYGIPDRLIESIIRVESGFNPRAVSRKGARGLMQLMPETASLLGVRDSFNPRENIDGGVRHLRGLMERFGNDLPLVLAAYNAGEQVVLAYRGIPPYRETRDYVTRVLALVGGIPAATPQSTFVTVESNGTLVYTNIPPRGRF